MSQSNEPKYKQLKDYIIQHIRNSNLKYNDPISSEIELMAQFGVSRHTVRKAIGDLVNEGWLYKQQGRGTFVANPMANKSVQGKLVGVITTYIKDYIFPEIISGIEEVLSENGYSIILGNTNNNTKKERIILKNMLNNNLAGLIIEPTQSVYPNHNQDLFDEFLMRGIPIMFIHATYQNIPASYIIEDDQKAGYLVTKHLIENGHTHIAGIFKQDDMQGHGRYSGYLKAMRDAELVVSDKNVLWYTTANKKSTFCKENIDQIRSKITNCSALVCYNDQIAIAMTRLLKTIDIEIPKDISMVSFDNSKMSDEVKLTTIAHPKGELGKATADGLLKLINKEQNQIHKVIDPKLIIRDSVKNIIS